MDYPFPILDWTRAEDYPAAEDLDLFQWAWEFLRRNPDYQRLYDVFARLPDSMRLEDGSLSNKNGKWRGTPWLGMRFFEDGACWYADPEPKRGESLDEYDERTGGGDVMPFADYLYRRFRVNHPARDPRLPFYLPAKWDPELLQPAGFTDWGEERFPQFVEVFELLDDLTIFDPYRIEAARERFRDGAVVTLAFDVRRNLETQLEDARELLADAREHWGRFEPPEGRRVSKRKIQRTQFPNYVRALDADAAGASVPEIAAALYPGEDNERGTGFRVSTKVRNNLRAAKGLRDGGYWEMLA